MDEGIVQQEVSDIVTKRRGNPAWQKGMRSPNPKGQSLGKEYLQKLLKNGFDKDSKTHKENLIAYTFKKARKSDSVLIALMKKLLPDTIKGEGGFGDSYLFLTKMVNNGPRFIIQPVEGKKENKNAQS